MLKKKFSQAIEVFSKGMQLLYALALHMTEIYLISGTEYGQLPEHHPK